MLRCQTRLHGYNGGGAGAYRTIHDSDMHVAAIIAAGGRGVRFGADRPKQFLEIGGRSILELSVAALAASDRIREIVVALPAEHVDSGSKALKQAIGRPITVVAG